MKVSFVGALIIATIAIGAAITSALAGRSGVFGLSTASKTATARRYDSLLALEKAVLTRQGIPSARADEALDVQTEIAQTDLMGKLESALSREYAGVWFEPATAKLHVGVASPAAVRTAALVVARAGFTAHVAETPVRSTWTQLLAVQREWNRSLAGLFARSQVETSLVPQNNAVSVTLSSSVSPLERAAFERRAAHARSKVLIAVASARGFAFTPARATECNKFAAKEAYCEKPISSGVRIQNQRGESCTAGPLAVPKGTKSATYLITAGHCLTLPGGVGSKWYAFNRNKESKEIGTAAEFILNTKGDVGAIKVADPGYWAETKGSAPVFANTSEWSTKNPETTYPVEGQKQPMIGAESCLEGQVIGQSCGVVSKLNETDSFKLGANVFTIEGLVIVVGATAEVGDSGGPWLFIDTSKSTRPAMIEGTLVGGDATGEDYEPLSKSFSLLSKLNLELLTKGNEERP